jgi:SAM-dependent methyltransferase
MANAAEPSSIQDARAGFNAALHTRQYERVHSDASHLRQLIAYLAVKPGGVYLDLATGNGYVGLEIAARHKDCHVIGVDIADEAIQINRDKALKLGLTNIEFEVVDGVTLDFPAKTFDGIICRYALHHFPQPAITLQDIEKSITCAGRVIIADGVRHDADEEDFINRLQALQRDGHVRLYRRDELMKLFHDAGLEELRSSRSTLPFFYEQTSEHEALLHNTSSAIQEKYGVDVRGSQVFFRFDILNIALSKAAKLSRPR